MKINEIKGGVSGKVPTWVYCDGKNVHEMSQAVANSYGYSTDYFSICIADLRCDEEDRKALKEEFPNLSEEAYRAILNANVRGVEVMIVGHDPSHRKLFTKLIGLRNKLREVNYIDEKLIEKINKVLRKCGEKEIDLEELFKY